MLKLIVSLALVAVCFARQDQFFVDVGVDNVIVRNVDNFQVKFFVDQVKGLATRNPVIVVDITGPQGYQKTLRFDDVPVYGDKYQSEILYQIFKQYAGQVDQVGYVNLLTTVTKYVQMNKVNPIVLFALQTVVSQDQEILNLYGQEYQKGIFGTYGDKEQGIFGLYGKHYGQQGVWGRETAYPNQYRTGVYGYQPFNSQYGQYRKPVWGYQPYGEYYGPYATQWQNVRGQGLWGQQYEHQIPQRWLGLRGYQSGHNFYGNQGQVY